ncbi:MAG: hypothetical protein LUE08_07620 [Akkermansiaceae bacterium]|nr:hypothetical protein [Akkermansiaceae bacterium]
MVSDNSPTNGYFYFGKKGTQGREVVTIGKSDFKTQKHYFDCEAKPKDWEKLPVYPENKKD